MQIVKIPLQGVLIAFSLLVAQSRAACNVKNIDGPIDQYGFRFSLDTWAEDRVVVVIFLGVECPLAKLYALRLNELYKEYAHRGVCFVAVNSNEGDSWQKVAQFAKEHELAFQYIKDEGNVVADHFGATRSPEAFVLDNDRVIQYQGRIDDQYAPGAHGRTQASRRLVAQAIDDLLAGRNVATPFTEPVGCHIDRVEVKQMTSTPITYSRHVASIINKHCVECHRPGQVAPFPLTNFGEVSTWKETIAEVVKQGRMPPWSADPQHGKFANDRSLPTADSRLLLDWIRFGAVEGDPRDLPPAPVFAKDGWNIEPDDILAMPASFTVPAEGVLDYQEFWLGSVSHTDRFIKAVEVMPGNRAAVHHATVYLRPQGNKGFHFPGALGDNYLAMYVPGNTVLRLPEGMVKRIPAGWDLVLSVHYVPNGSVQTDRSIVGLQYAKSAGKEVATKLLMHDAFVLEPYSADTRVEKTWTLEDDLLLVAMYPHMHLRGKSMRFEADYPDGSREILLNVPDYDFQWQHRYVLAQQKLLPAGSVLRCVAHYDNSSNNPNNPDPSATVKPGVQTAEEMFLGVWEVMLANDEPWHQNAIRTARERLVAYRPHVILCGLFGLFWMIWFSRRRRKTAEAYPFSFIKRLKKHLLAGSSAC